jgi:hypothetical protein
MCCAFSKTLIKPLGWKAFYHILNSGFIQRFPDDIRHAA